MDVSRDTRSAASRRERPEATSSATADAAAAACWSDATTAAGEKTSVISPFGGSRNRARTVAGVPRSVADLCRRCMAKVPADRPSSAIAALALWSELLPADATVIAQSRPA